MQLPKRGNKKKKRRGEEIRDVWKMRAEAQEEKGLQRTSREDEEEKREEWHKRGGST